MRKNALRETGGFPSRSGKGRTRNKLAGVFACAAVFCAAHALILPAATLEKEPEYASLEPVYSTAEEAGSAPLSLEAQGVYPGKQLDNGSWVAMDGPDEDSANLRVTITLAEDHTAMEDCYPFIRRVDPGSEYYPDEDAVRRAVGAVNDVQCCQIHWVKLTADQEPDFDTGMETAQAAGATIELEYLKPDAQLKGVKGGRKLRIFSSRSPDGTDLVEISNSVQNVRLMDKNYAGFTFRVTQPCPYVFVSEYVEQGYVQGLKVDKLVDGSAPFDADDKPGRDSGDHNKIVRSYDTIQYTLEASFGAREDGVEKEEVNMYFELTLNKSATAARFDTDKMLWLGSGYSVEYLSADGGVIMVQDSKGKLFQPSMNADGSVYRDEHGFAQPDPNQPVSMNAQVNGSTAGPDSYKVTSGGVARQRLVGWTTLTAKPGENILAGTQKFDAAITVRNADNGEVFAPCFRLWLEGNEENYGPETQRDGVMLPAAVVDKNILDISDDDGGYTQHRVTVSAGASFNLQLKKNTDMSYKNWFDFKTGGVVAPEIHTELDRLANLPANHGKANPAEFVDENGNVLSEEIRRQYADYRYGRITCYGITLQLYTDAPETNRAAKGLKGMSLPVGDIEFDLNFWSSAGESGALDHTGQYPAILWDYNENIPANTKYRYNYVDPGRGQIVTPNDGLGNGGRNIFWDGEVRSPYAKGAAPSSYIAYHDGCYYGGDWTLMNGDTEARGKDALYALSNPALVTGTGVDTTYHFRVSDYDFDFDSQHFPLRDAGNSGNVTGYDTYARAFSAGCVQVLSVFPRVHEEGSTNLHLNVKISNLKLETRAGQKLEPVENAATGYEHEVNENDNTKQDQIVLYAPGSMTKGNSFNGPYNSQAPRNTSDGFLGTDYWTTSYDCSTFAGDDIWIVSYGMISSGSDYRMRSMNLLQLFDSRALSIRDEPDVFQNYDAVFDEPGDAAFLYAADPDYPEGYDTNRDGVLAYMSTVREEDLRYYTSLDELQEAGYTCIGVLMELRGCDLLGGKYQYMRIPVRVNGDDSDLVSKTVATVNTFRIWSYDLGTITWANGEWDNATDKNTLEGYQAPKSDPTGQSFAGELANKAGSSPPLYVKTEYRDGHQIQNTHLGGTLAGNSLLILAYKAHVDIGVDNKSDEGKIAYTQAKGETVVDYRIKNIKAEVTTDITGATPLQTTTLAVRAVLDENRPAGRDERISVSGASYRMEGLAVGADGKPTGQTQSFAISSDEKDPTVLAFWGTDGRYHTIRVYAKNEFRQSVEFVILNAPVGIQLPDITFQANFSPVTKLENNETIKTSAYISGSGDVRAYDVTKGNTNNITVGVILGGGTNLTKEVDVRYIELGGLITYTITYTNTGDETIRKMFFYDLLPKPRDIRGSDYHGTVGLRHVDVKTEGPGTPSSADVYYSTAEYRTLYDTVKVFGGTMDSTGTVSGMDEDKVEKMLADTSLFKPLGSMGGTAGEPFHYADAVDQLPPAEMLSLMSRITGLYVKANSLEHNQSIVMTFTIKTQNNQAGDWYRNIANSWIAGSETPPLTSSKMETVAISRGISGVVWHDKNLNGVRDSGEPLLEGVTATLFKKGPGGKYELCTADVTGGPVTPAATNEKGEYAFTALAAGDYLVAFSGERLRDYTGPTSYQVHGKNDGITSDGKDAADLTEEFDKAGYAYVIQYSTEAVPIRLSTLSEIGNHLNNYRQDIDHQDLGLVTAGPELPVTGGSGTAWYTLSGLALMAAAALWPALRRKRPAP